MNVIKLADLKKTLNFFKRNGIINTYYAAKERLDMRRDEQYAYISPDDTELAGQREESADAEGWPQVSVVMPAYETPAEYLRAAVDSVIAQSYPNWKLIVSDSSRTDRVFEVMDSYSGESRIIYLRSEYARGISENTNAGLEYLFKHDEAVDYIGFMDHDDVLAPDALYHMAGKTVSDRNAFASVPEDMAAAGNKHPVIIYSDEDKISEESGIRTYFDPHKKYDFNYDLLLSNNYICHLTLIRSDIMRDLRFRPEYDGAQDYDMILQVIRKLAVPTADLGRYIIHVPRILYHWRSHALSTATNTESKSYAYEAGLRALTEHVALMYKQPGDQIRVSHSKHLGFYEVGWADTENGSCGENAGRSNTDEYINTIFSRRTDIGAVIGRIIDKKGCMAECIFDSEGKPLYAGLNRHFAGAFNRFDCAQDVAAADLRYIKVRPELEELLETYADPVMADPALSRENARAFASKLKERGLMILYNPKCK